MFGFRIADAQDATAPSAAATPVSPDDVNAVAKQLWCPLCSNVRLDSCELKACSQMKDVIAQQLADGTEVQEIKNYFVAQYGPQVLGEPPMEGFNWLAWLLPIAVVIGGAAFIWTRARKMVQTPKPEDDTPDQISGMPADPYAEKLDKELKQYD
ncbi:MAG: cytochrome c-type biogenesis protein CcmH [Anaerolineales bacterium]|nr:cytochrome c-type biogenesis protein CcmH [Anaerolineales bacterium]